MSDVNVMFHFCKEEFNLVNGNKTSQKISLFTLSTCMWCKKTKKYLNDNNIKYRFIDVDKIDKNIKKEILDCLRKAFKERIAFPFLIVDDQPIIGYNPEKYEKLIKREGV